MAALERDLAKDAKLETGQVKRNDAKVVTNETKTVNREIKAARNEIETQAADDIAAMLNGTADPSKAADQTKPTPINVAQVTLPEKDAVLPKKPTVPAKDAGASKEKAGPAKVKLAAKSPGLSA